jgi:hypothetical protein
MSTLTKFARVLTLPVLAAGGCSGEGDAEAEQEPPVEEYACLHIAEGQIVDVSLERADARTITVGREPYRVNLYPGEAGFLRFEAGAAAELVLVLDHPGSVPAVWTDDDRIELDPGAPNDSCEEDLPEVIAFQVGAGEHWLEVGPAFQGNIWMMLAER